MEDMDITSATASTSAVRIAVTAMGTTPSTTATVAPLVQQGPASATSGMSSTSGTPLIAHLLLCIESLTLNVNKPQYDWNAPNLHKEFRVLQKQMNSWFVLHGVRNFMAFDAIFSCLGKKGYAIHDEWVMDSATKQGWQAFLKHFESTLDTKVGPKVRVYDLEAIHKKRDETACELVACI